MVWSDGSRGKMQHSEQQFDSSPGEMQGSPTAQSGDIIITGHSYMADPKAIGLPHQSKDLIQHSMLRNIIARHDIIIALPDRRSAGCQGQL